MIAAAVAVAVAAVRSRNQLPYPGAAARRREHTPCRRCPAAGLRWAARIDNDGRFCRASLAIVRLLLLLLLLLPLVVVVLSYTGC
jgi:hypothetical protein